MSRKNPIGASVAPDARAYSPPSPVAFLVPVVTFAALEAFARSQADSVARAETSFLAFQIVVVLTAIAASSRRSARELAWTALFVFTAAWIVDYGPHRAVVITCLLLGGLAVSLSSWWKAGVRPWRVPVAMVIGFQCLLRPDLCLNPSWRSVIDLLLIPLVCGVALGFIERGTGVHRALMIAVLSGTALPGWNGTLAVGLVVLALVARRQWVPALGLLALGLLWNPLIVLCFGIAAGAFVGIPRRPGVLSFGLATATVILAWHWDLDPELLLASFGVGGLLLPGVVGARHEDAWRAVRGVLCAALLTVIIGRPDVIAMGWGVGALALPRTGLAALWQRWWALWLASWVTLVAGYPWLQDEPLTWALERAGVSWTSALAIVFGFYAMVLFAERRVLSADGLGGRLVFGAPLALVVLFGFWMIPPTAVLPVSYQGVRLDSIKPRWSKALEATDVQSLVIDSNLIHGVGLEPGTPVARAELVDAGGEVVETWFLLAGEHTAEWAAARPDIASLPGFEAPSAWLSQVAPDRTFFAQRYRTEWTFEKPHDIERITLWRHGRLPSDVAVMIYRMELRH